MCCFGSGISTVAVTEMRERVGKCTILERRTRARYWSMPGGKMWKDTWNCSAILVCLIGVRCETRPFLLTGTQTSTRVLFVDGDIADNGGDDAAAGYSYTNIEKNVKFPRDSMVKMWKYFLGFVWKCGKKVYISICMDVRRLMRFRNALHEKNILKTRIFFIFL